MIKSSVLLIIFSLLLSPLAAVSASATIYQSEVAICEEAEADVLRLYFAIFNREHDLAGGIYWVEVHRSGKSLDHIAYWMTQGPEFKSRYLRIKTDDEFLEKVYKNVFTRTSDEKGKKYWTDEIANGLERHLVIRWMAQSPELKGRHGYKINDSCQNKVQTLATKESKISNTNYPTNVQEFIDEHGQNPELKLWKRNFNICEPLDERRYGKRTQWGTSGAFDVSQLTWDYYAFISKNWNLVGVVPSKASEKDQNRIGAFFYNDYSPIRNRFNKESCQKQFLWHSWRNSNDLPEPDYPDSLKFRNTYFN